ncbi:MAG: hypothetical protein KF789_05250 [Bdellovibrionaceae bacterium]|nr:hypothetical protein [Pseudobdellovibrionaceae bacterium]
MKKTLLIAALSMAATPAFASKARLSSLGNAEHLSDVQRSFDRPEQVVAHGEYATLELGQSDGSGDLGALTPRAEAGFTKQVSEGNYLGFYFNRQPKALVDTVTQLEGTLPAAFQADGLLTQAFLMDNSFNLLYGSTAGDIAWGANLFYLATDSKTMEQISNTAATADIDVSNRKTNVMGLSLGAATSSWEVDAVIGLQGKSTFNGDNATSPGLQALIDNNDEAALESSGNYTLRGAYKMDNMYYFARYNMGGSKLKVAGNDKLKADKNEIEVGAIHSLKSEGSEFFYGVSYLMTNLKKSTDDAAVKAAVGWNEEKTATAALPLIVGVEADANSWLVLRGSIKHNLPFLSTTKVTTDGSGDADTLGGNTVVSAGAGMKFNKFSIDTLIAAASKGNIGTDAGNFLTNASLTYNF